jgi:hypothetical protein
MTAKYTRRDSHAGAGEAMFRLPPDLSYAAPAGTVAQPLKSIKDLSGRRAIFAEAQE